ncbi:Ribosomal protein L30, ferredoxin-like fold domain [Phaffia rhodozyma]|uniref:Large ribosomal subunit protein uL30m n=1 Tax=Phaffia rhodozyma TaxID=264483 RepID=A0A0F7SJX9_PHARH|nr:Ribosomal protein L30, ferredoxin-like fold domain [Phaffia rhodozyma]
MRDGGDLDKTVFEYLNIHAKGHFVFPSLPTRTYNQTDHPHSPNVTLQLGSQSPHPKMRLTPSLQAMGLRQPQYLNKKIAPRQPPNCSFPHYHPLRSQYPFPAVHHISNKDKKKLPPSAGPVTHYRITLRRSAIGLPEKVRATCEQLGLTKRDRTVFHPFSATTAGGILRIKELIEVRNVSWDEMEAEMKRGKGEGKGWKQGTKLKAGGTPFEL